MYKNVVNNKIDLFKLHGRPFTCNREKTQVCGLVSVDEEKQIVYLCHDDRRMGGFTAKDRLGYLCSYAIAGVSSDLISEEVRQTLSVDVPDEPIFPKGSTLIRVGTESKVYVVEVLGDIVFGRFMGIVKPYEAEQLSASGWVLVKEPPKPEELVLTMDEVASKFGIDVKLLKIKK